MLLETLGEPVSGGLVTGEKSGPLRQGRRGVRSVFWPLGLSLTDRASPCPVQSLHQLRGNGTCWGGVNRTSWDV